MRRPPEILSRGERVAVAALIRRLRTSDAPPLRQVVLFGSRARGDGRDDSDLDLLLLCDVDTGLRERAARVCASLAGVVRRRTGVRLDPWTLTTADLQQGRRTPMLVDALEDGIGLWPAGALVPRLPFTPDDAVFCAGCLLDWVDAGGLVVRRALAEGRLHDAAARARDDVTRLAAAALLLTGDTRHRRRGSLWRFHRRFVRVGRVSDTVRPAIAWADAAWPPDDAGGRRPPPTPAAVGTAWHGYRLAARMQREVVPRILEQVDGLASAGLLRPPGPRARRPFSVPAGTPSSAPPP